MTAGRRHPAARGLSDRAEGFAINSRVDLTIDGEPVLGADGLLIIADDRAADRAGLQVNEAG